MWLLLKSSITLSLIQQYIVVKTQFCLTKPKPRNPRPPKQPQSPHIHNHSTSWLKPRFSPWKSSVLRRVFVTNHGLAIAVNGCCPCKEETWCQSSGRCMRRAWTWTQCLRRARTMWCSAWAWLAESDFWATWFLKLKAGFDFGEEEDVGSGVVELGEVRKKGEGVEVWETVAAWSCILFSNKNIW